MEENKNAPEIKITKGKFLTWLENYWYHYKWHTVFIAAALIMLSVCLGQCVSTENYDTVIVYAGPNYLGVNETRQLEDVIGNILPYDRDGNKQKNAAMKIIEIHSEEQIKNSQLEIDRQRNITQQDEYFKYLKTGESSVYLVDPWLYEQVAEFEKCSLSELFGENLPKGAIDGYGIRLGDTDIYKDNEAVRLLPADTVIYLRNPHVMGASANEKRYQFEKDVFIAIVTYTSPLVENADTVGA